MIFVQFISIWYLGSLVDKVYKMPKFSIVFLSFMYHVYLFLLFMSSVNIYDDLELHNFLLSLHAYFVVTP